MKKVLVIGASVVMMGVGVVMTVAPVLAGSCGGVETSIIDCDEENGIEGILHLVINIMTGLIGVLAVAGMVYSGIQYQMSAGDAAAMAKAKNRIIQIVIGLIIFAVMWAVLDVLIPGGILAG